MPLTKGHRWGRSGRLKAGCASLSFNLQRSVAKIAAPQPEMDLILRVRRIDATEAHRIGLANEVVTPGNALERSLEVAGANCSLFTGGHEN